MIKYSHRGIFLGNKVEWKNNLGGKKMKKSGFLFVIIAFITAGSVVTYGTMHYNKEVQAEQLAIQKREITQKKIEIVNKAEQAVELAYKTRDKNHVDAANHAIKRITSENQQVKSALQVKMTKLAALLKQLVEVESAIKDAEDFQKESDIKTAQKLIDKMTDEYLKADKKAAQLKLDDLTTKIKKAADEKAKAEEEAAQQAAQLEAEANNSSETDSSFTNQYEEATNQSEYTQPSYPNYTQPQVPPQNSQEENQSEQEHENDIESEPELVPNESEQEDNENPSGIEDDEKTSSTDNAN